MKKKAILLVEDNPDDELLMLDALSENDIDSEVVVARNGVEALDYIFGEGKYMGRDVKDRPAIILLDLKLPKVDGLEVLRRIRQDPRTHLQPITILTSSNEEEDILKGYELGVNSYVRKPVDFDAFLQAAGQLGLYWLSLNEYVP